MGDLLFFIKTIVITFLLAAVMQTQIGKRTIEAHVMTFIVNSPIVEPLQQVGEGGAAFVRDSWTKLKGIVESKIKTQEVPGQRQLGIHLQRSKQYIQEQAEKAKEKLRSESHSQVDRFWDRKNEKGPSTQKKDP
ncbi:MAG: hypothetical protein H6624_13540 [Bdellovibrionaceae bacterium]|nr:hypothetical protein [Bdellovibrionales bacterium]MCB9085366.1 hypothetical protein [Pseudobdellovibrionaceae bacterium]